MSVNIICKELAMPRLLPSDWSIVVVLIHSAYNSHRTPGFRRDLLETLKLLGTAATNEITHEQGFVGWVIGGLVLYLILRHIMGL